MLHHDHAGEKTQEKEKKKREPALAYQFGNTVIVEDEHGEVIKKYEIPPDRSRQSEKPTISEKIRHRLARVRSYFGISHGEAEAAASHGVFAGESSKGTVKRRDEKKKKRIQEEDSDDERIRFTVNAGARRMSKAEFIQQIQQMDQKARTKFVENSDVPEPVRGGYLRDRAQKQPKENVSDLGEEEDGFERDPQREIHASDQFEGIVSQSTHLDQHPPIFDEDDIIDTRYIPWERFPNISRLRAFFSNPFDRGDGERFTTDELEHVESLLFHACEDLTCSRSLTDYQTRQITHLGRMGRICLILDLIEQRQLLRDFIRLKIADDSLPLQLTKLQGMLDPGKNDEITAERFFAEQFRVVSRDWSNGVHHVMHRREALPFRPLRSIGFGSQGSIDEVQLPNIKGTCARKRWIAAHKLKQITARFDDEVKIIKKVATHPHILDLLASYIRGREFGLLLPLADCDLWQILAMNPSERKDAISNDSLLQSVGCLSSGLCFMHDKGIKHKDIKPQNIVLRQGGFQFTDFGLSKDISDLSHSTTDGADRGTLKYMAPEVSAYQPHGRAADVFSLACVLFEIFSVLRGLSVDDADSFSALAPFHNNSPGIYSWIDTFVQAIWDFLGYNPDILQLQHLFSQDPTERPHMRDVVLDMARASDHPKSLFCNICLKDLPVIF